MRAERLGAFYQYWGKAGGHDDSTGGSCHLLVYHSLDVAAVAKVLLEQQSQLLDRMAGAMGLLPEQAKTWCIFLLGLHDLGKFAVAY